MFKTLSRITVTSHFVGFFVPESLFFAIGSIPPLPLPLYRVLSFFPTPGHTLKVGNRDFPPFPFPFDFSVQEITHASIGCAVLLHTPYPPFSTFYFRLSIFVWANQCYRLISGYFPMSVLCNRISHRPINCHCV